MRIDISYKGQSGVYQITCKANGRIYIGSAHCLYTRLHVHISLLNKGTHNNEHLLKAWRKYGSAAFEFKVLEVCDKSVTIAKEQHFLDLLRPEFNICKQAGKTVGYKHSEETKAIMRQRKSVNYFNPMVGKKHTPETIEKLKAKAIERGVSAELVAAAKAANTGRKHSADLRDRLAVLQSKITPDQARTIKAKYSEGVYQTVLAEQFGVSQRLIVRVLSGIGIYGTQPYQN